MIDYYCNPFLRIGGRDREGFLDEGSLKSLHRLGMKESGFPFYLPCKFFGNDGLNENNENHHSGFAKAKRVCRSNVINKILRVVSDFQGVVERRIKQSLFL